MCYMGGVRNTKEFRGRLSLFPMRTQRMPSTSAAVTPAAIRARRRGAPPLVCLTAYTAYMARLLDAHVDILLVGDSLGMVVYGMESTGGVTLEMMTAHGKAVAGNASHAMVVVDMPRGSYEESPQAALANASRLREETGCAAVKLEGGASRAETVACLTDHGIPVMGHIGLLPQSVHAGQSYRIVGRETEERMRLEADAHALVEAGAFALVLEGMVEPLARRISESVSIPTIGIGASASCGGQILVTEDMLGLMAKTPRFVKHYAALGEEIAAAAAAYAAEIRLRRFPDAAHVYGESARDNSLPVGGLIPNLPRIESLHSANAAGHG